MEKTTTRIKHLIIILLFIFLTSLEIGIFEEIAWHGWSWGDVPLVYTKTGNIGTGILLLFIPVSVIVIFIIYIMKYKKGQSKKEFFLNCRCALFGIVIAIGLYFITPGFPVFELGRQMTSFLINYFNWMELPVPG